MELTQDDVIRILKLIDESPMGRVSLQVGDFKLEVEKGTGPGSESAISVRTSRPAAAAKTLPPARLEAGVQEKAESKQAPGTDENLLAIKAPLLGIFYRRSQPGVPPYVEEGSPVDEDTTVGLKTIFVRLADEAREVATNLARETGWKHHLPLGDPEEFSEVIPLLPVLAR